MKWTATASLLVLLLGPVVFAGCTSDGEGQNYAANCTPGQQIDCGCPDGSQSVQQCNDDGTYGPCDCPDLDVGTVNADATDASDTGSNADGDTGGTDVADSDGQDATEQDAGTQDAGDDTVDCSEIPQAGSRDMRWTHYTDPNFSVSYTAEECPPFPNGCSVHWRVENDHFLAVEFEAPPNDPDAPETAKSGYVITVTASHALNAPHTLAFSRCPGDFSEALPEGKCRAGSASHSFWWSVMGEETEFVCQLEPGETHYLNFIYAKGDNLEEQTCDSDNEECGALFQMSN